MKINVEVDLEEFLDDLDGEQLSSILNEYVKDEIMRIVKRDPKYKAFINKKAKDVLDGLDV